MKGKYLPWYKMHGLKHITGFVSPLEKQKLKKLARAADKSLSRYITRILQNHIWEMEAADRKETIARRTQ